MGIHVHRQGQGLGDRFGVAMGELHAVSHGYTPYRDEWDYVDSPHPSVLAAVVAHVNQIDCDGCAFNHGSKY